jgi:hypothetical protein
MKKISKSELLVLNAYLELSVIKLLNHKFELEEDYIHEHIAGFFKGERYDEDIIAFSKQ